MFGFHRAKKSKKIKEAVALLNNQEDSGTLSANYDESLKNLKELFRDDDVMQFREIKNKNAGDLRFCFVYCDGLVDSELIGSQLIRPLLKLKVTAKEKITADAILEQVVQTGSGKTVSNYQEIIRSITGGDTLLFVDGLKEGMLFSIKKFDKRSVTEPEAEKVLSGPREGFTETLLSNLSMIRRRLKTNKLKMRYYTVGRETQTQLAIAYLDGIVNENILKELYRRLDTIDIDGVLDANYITELVRDNPWSPFRSIGNTERPDVVVGKMLEGRIALFVDGTPVVLTLPYLFIENFQSNEDYYMNFYYSSFSRLLRILGFMLTILVPAIYVAITAYHHEMIPSPLLIRIATEQQKVPLPAALECFLLLLVFDILRETGVRMPTSVGQALSIVGALVVGQAAVEAGLVAAPIIIVVAMSGITSLLIPKMNAPVIFVRIIILALGAFLGFLGVTLGCALLLVHVLSLQSFGISQMAPERKLRYQEIKDTIIRAPWWQMRLRPLRLSENIVREKNKKGDHL